MSADDWYLNTDWTPEIASRFEAKLHRARRKEQYLRIQASMLSERRPEIALALLERYFKLPDDYDHASAHVARARAHLALGRDEDAMVAYEAALAREAAFPRLLTQACIDLPFLIATKGLSARYEQALALLDAHKSRLMFPVDWFKWHGARALIHAARNDLKSAKFHAGEALSAASRMESGYKNHPKAGLAGERYESLRMRLEEYRAA